MTTALAPTATLELDALMADLADARDYRDHVKAAGDKASLSIAKATVARLLGEVCTVRRTAAIAAKVNAASTTGGWGR